MRLVVGACLFASLPGLVVLGPRRTPARFPSGLAAKSASLAWSDLRQLAQAIPLGAWCLVAAKSASLAWPDLGRLAQAIPLGAWCLVAAKSAGLPWSDLDHDLNFVRRPCPCLILTGVGSAPGFD